MDRGWWTLSGEQGHPGPRGGCRQSGAGEAGPAGSPAEVYLDAAVPEGGVSVKTWDPGDEDAVRRALADADFRGRGGNC